MALLPRFDPPAFLPDFNAIPGQLDAWHRAVSSWFDAVIKIERDLIGAEPQYFNPAKFDPGGVAVEQAIPWNAFPKELVRRYGRERALRMADSPWPYEWYRRRPADPEHTPTRGPGLSGLFTRLQEEYCEWRVDRDPATNKIVRITFTSEPPEYYQALFGLVPGDGETIPDAVFPGDTNRLLELYREFTGHDVPLSDLVAAADVLDGNGNVVTGKGQYMLHNKWNTTHGIVHLCANPNSLVAEIALGGDATVLRDDPRGRRLVEPDALVCYAAYGGPNRNSDPTIGAAVNALARLGAYVTLKNPIGLYMNHLDLSGWAAPDGGNVTDFVRIVRGSPGMIERLVVEAPPGRGLDVGDLTIAGEPIRYGGQVAECITVKLTGVAHLVPQPAPRPSVRPEFRGTLDPHFANMLNRATPLNQPLPPGLIEAFLHEGTESPTASPPPTPSVAGPAAVAAAAPHDASSDGTSHSSDSSSPESRTASSVATSASRPSSSRRR